MNRNIIACTCIATLGLVAAALALGPLNPPAGSVASSNRTLQEIYDKIPAPGASDGRTPIGATTGTGTITISQPGSYVLTGTIANSSPTSTNAILISASDVTLDLNGYAVTCSSTGSFGINISSNASRITIRNGRIAGGFAGITTNLNNRDLLLEDLSISGCKNIGINLVDASASTVRRCRVTDIGLSTTSAEAFAIIGISAAGGGSRIEDCTVANIVNNNNAGLIRAYSIAGFYTIENCIAYNVSVSSAPNTGIFCLSGAPLRRNCRVINFSTSYNGGTDGGGNL